MCGHGRRGDGRDGSRSRVDADPPTFLIAFLFFLSTGLCLFLSRSRRKRSEPTFVFIQSDEFAAVGNCRDWVPMDYNLTVRGRKRMRPELKDTLTYLSFMSQSISSRPRSGALATPRNEHQSLETYTRYPELCNLMSRRKDVCEAIETYRMYTY